MFLVQRNLIVMLLACLAGLVACEHVPPAATTVHVMGQVTKTLNVLVQATPTTNTPIQAVQASIAVPTLPGGDQLHPTALSAPVVHGRLRLFHTTTPPVIEQQEAMQIVIDGGSTWFPGMHINGNTVTVNALYGLATYELGSTTPSTSTLTGTAPSGGCDNPMEPCFSVQSCHAGQCVSTGKLVGPLHNRPVWLLDYGNVRFTGSRPPADNHQVYLVDATEKFVLKDWTYQGP